MIQRKNNNNLSMKETIRQQGKDGNLLWYGRCK